MDSTDSETSDDDAAPDLYSAPEEESPAKKPVPMQRDETVTLPDEYEVEKILSGPREDGKFRVKWFGFSMKDCTWEPQNNLPLTCFDDYYDNRGSSAESSDESGDDKPIRLSIPTKKKTNPPKATTGPAQHPNPPDYDECLRQYAEEAENVCRQKIADADKAPTFPRRVHRIIPVVATRTTFQSHRTGLRLRKGRKQ